jgi:hypothetical protein
LAKDAPIYVATHDMLDWLAPHLESWPRPQRFLLARQVMESATQFYRLLLRARKVAGLARAETLLEADVELETLKCLLRLGQERQYMSLGQFQHISGILIDIGKQLGGWRASLERQLDLANPGQDVERLQQ